MSQKGSIFMTTLNLPSLKKNDLKGWVDNVRSKIKEGKINPLKVHTEAKAMEFFAKEITTDKEIKDLAIEEARKYKKGEQFLNGAEFEIRNGYNIYDWDDDPEIRMHNEEIKHRKAKIEERKEFLKQVIRTSENGGVTFNQETGEEIKPPSVKSMRGETLNIKL